MMPAMKWRVVGLVGSVVVAGGLPLLWPAPPWLAPLASGLAALAWGLVEQRHWQRLWRWLADPAAREAPELPGAWGELTAGMRRALKAANRKARKARLRLQAFLAALQASPNGVVLLDKDGCIEWANLMAGEHLGFDAKRDLGQRFYHLVQNPDFLRLLRDEEHGGLVEIDGRDARPGHPHRVAVQTLPFGKGRRLLLTRDVTALQLAETMRRDFVANVSHEIRSPLTVIVGFIETLQTLPLSEQERGHYLDLMRQQAQRMQNLVSDLLTLSRLEGSPIPDDSQWVPAGELLNEAAQQARALADVLHGGRQTLQLHAGPALEVAGARSELLSALGNLLSNAVRYTPAEGRIEAGWRLLADGAVEFFVTDTGPGIAPEHLPRLTERFYRVDRSRSRESGGTGLGLAIVKHVVQRHGGQLRIDSTLGRGSTFALQLPPARVLVQAGR